MRDRSSDNEAYVGETVTAYFTADHGGIFEVTGDFKGTEDAYDSSDPRRELVFDDTIGQVKVKYWGPKVNFERTVDDARFEESRLIGMTRKKSD